MRLEQKIKEDVKQALKAGERNKVSALRMLLAEIKNAEIREGKELGDEKVTQVIVKQVKKWEEAAAEYEKAGQNKRASKEKKDAELLRRYLPKQLSEGEIEKLVKKVIAETGATSMKDMGKVMQAIIPRLKGRADGSKVSAIVKEILG